MTTLSEKIADILAYHEFHFKIADGKTDDGPLHCDCEQWQDDTCAQFENHRAHQADMLAALIREAQAEALEAAAEVWGDGEWSDVWAADEVECDVTATQSTVRWIQARAKSIRDTP